MASKFLEGQISNVPVWLRHKPEYKGIEEAKKIVLWEERIKAKSTNHRLKETTKLEIENELKEIEEKWKKEMKISAEKSQVEEDKKQPSEESEIDKQKREEIYKELQYKARQLRSKFLQSMDIHAKPTELNILREIFEFKTEEEEKENAQSTSADSSSKKRTFQVDTNKINHLLYIEYICERIRELITPRTKSYLLEDEPSNRPSLNEEREREELIDKADNYVLKANSLFSQIGQQSTNRGEI
jgi:hypothetical protein